MAETHRVRDLAQMIADKTGTKIDFISNPRNEAAENELEVKNDKFGNLGVDFKSLDGTLLEEVGRRRFFLSQCVPSFLTCNPRVGSEVRQYHVANCDLCIRNLFRTL